ncbi:TetR/AcrR family transcriptional regulator [Nocardioides bruguierae]|uniref:TetR/AcrR family transcriptional regulator n=1 Tax=Nocardioides bruguierae TaxID=2945102 RepID=UPI0020201A2C|nr:TetR/AcrR family transcriptional regulator [Nocardioides bruguierae]MCL8027617.1 TetR/AcrR family transcriptional regulator [Nocardioides bruguierae]
MDEALALADAEGVEALTMRSLAARVGVQPMSLYHHVANKEAVLDALVERVVAEIALPSAEAVAAGADWRTELAGRCSSTRLAMTRHPWCLHLIETRTSPGPVLLGHHEAVLATLAAAGFDTATAGLAFAVLDAFTFGFALQQATLPMPTEAGPGSAAEIAAVAEPMLAAMGEAYPHVAGLAREQVLVPGYDFAAHFDVGLAVLLDGLEARRAAGA